MNCVKKIKGLQRGTLPETQEKLKFYVIIYSRIHEIFDIPRLKNVGTFERVGTYKCVYRTRNIPVVFNFSAKNFFRYVSWSVDLTIGLIVVEHRVKRYLDIIAVRVVLERL